MNRRYEVDDTQWKRIKPYSGNTLQKNWTPLVG